MNENLDDKSRRRGVENGMNFPANSEEEWKMLVKSDPKEIKFIRDKADWLARINEVPLSSEGHLLYGCTQKEVDDFTTKLVFYGDALAGMHYGMVKPKLSIKLLLKLLKEFGIGPGMMDDHDGYYCESRGTCAKDLFSICTSNC